MKLLSWSQKNKDLFIRTLATVGMALNLFLPFFGIAFGAIALTLTHKDAKSDWRNIDFYYAIFTIVAGIFILYASIMIRLRQGSSSSSSS